MSATSLPAPDWKLIDENGVMTPPWYTYFKSGDSTVRDAGIDLDDLLEAITTPTAWTPTLTTDGVDFTSVTYDGQRGGIYIKIGRIVYIQGSMRTDAITVGGATGNLVIGGLPFTVVTGFTGAGSAENPPVMVTGQQNWAAERPDSGVFRENTTHIELFYHIYTTAESIGEAENMVPGTIGTGGNANEMRFSGFYIAAA